MEVKTLHSYLSSPKKTKAGDPLTIVSGVVGIWAIFGSGILSTGWGTIGAILLLMFASFFARGGGSGVALYFAVGVVLGFWFFNAQSQSSDLLFHVSIPYLQQNLLIIFIALFFAGVAQTDFPRCRRRTLTVALPIGILAGTAIFFKPSTTVLEQNHVEIGEGGIITTQRNFYALKDDEGKLFAGLPGGADTPWVLWGSLGREGIRCKDGIRLVGEFRRGSKFLPVRNGKNKIPLWTYLGGGEGGVVSPLSVVWTPILNYGKL